MAREIVIAPEKEGQKGRSFSALYLAGIRADALWQGGQAETENLRPVWCLIATTEAEVRPFMANLRLGRKAAFMPAAGGGYVSKRDAQAKLELLKSARYRIELQRTAHGTAALAFLPDLFALDPGMVDPAGIKFCMLLEQAEVDRQAEEWSVTGAMDHLRRIKFHRFAGEQDRIRQLLPLAPCFAAYLDRRTRCPLLKDPRFYAQLLVRCLDIGMASLTKPPGHTYHRDAAWGVNTRLDFETEGVEELGYAPALAFHAGHEDFERLLADCASEFFAVTGT